MFYNFFFFISTDYLEKIILRNVFDYTKFYPNQIFFTKNFPLSLKFK